MYARLVPKEGRTGLSLPLETVHEPMIVRVQDETKAPQPSVVQKVLATEQRSL